MDRRNFTKGLGIAAFLPLAGVSSKAKAQKQLRVRRSVQTMLPDDPFFAQYARAVEEMHRLPASSRRSWRSQALTHLNHCVHGGQDFFHWHRHYITYFERLCGSLIGDPTFALAYWDWTANEGRIPDPFFDINFLNVEHWRDESNAGSPNWGDGSVVTTIGARGLSKGTSMHQHPDAGGIFNAETIQTSLALPTYGDFLSSIENSPHGTAHIIVGTTESADSSGHMRSGLSPLDPIFWLHHCNVDRLWEEWRSSPDHETPAINRTYANQFVRLNGNLAVNVTAAMALDATEMGFGYERPEVAMAGRSPGGRESVARRSAPQAAAAPRTASGPRPASPREQLGQAAGLTASVGTVGATSVAVRGVVAAGAPTSGAGPRAESSRPAASALSGRILLKLNDVKIDRDADNVIVKVFINSPNLTAATPYTDKHYAGTFTLFGGDHSSHAGHGGGRQGGTRAPAKGAAIVFDASRTLARLAKDGPIDASRLNVQLVAVPAAKSKRADAKVTVGSVEVIRA